MRNFKRNTDEAVLNLTPIMNLFVALIPFLIVSSAFIRLGGVDVQAPSAASGVQTPNSLKKDSELRLSFEVQESKVIVTGYDQNYDQEISGVKAEFPIAELSRLVAYVDGLSQKQYKIGPSLFHASPETKFENAISVLNAMRSSQHVKEIVMAAGVVE